MQYLLYSLSIILAIYSFFALVYPRKSKRLLYFLGYLFPFWIWSTLFLILSLLFWYLREGVVIMHLFSLAFFLAGMFILFLPQRKIKKNLESLLGVPDNKIKTSGLLALFLILIILFCIRR